MQIGADPLPYREFQTVAPQTALGRAFTTFEAEHPDAAKAAAEDGRSSTPVSAEAAAKARELLLEVADGKIALQKERFGYIGGGLTLSINVDRRCIDLLSKVAMHAPGADAMAAGANASTRATTRANLDIAEKPLFAPALSALPIGDILSGTLMVPSKVFTTADKTAARLSDYTPEKRAAIVTKTLQDSLAGLRAALDRGDADISVKYLTERNDERRSQRFDVAFTGVDGKQTSIQIGIRRGGATGLAPESGRPILGTFIFFDTLGSSCLHDSQNFLPSRLTRTLRDEGAAPYVHAQGEPRSEDAQINGDLRDLVLDLIRRENKTADSNFILGVTVASAANRSVGVESRSRLSSPS